jgi:hypothetical protein
MKALHWIIVGLCFVVVAVVLWLKRHEIRAIWIKETTAQQETKQDIERFSEQQRIIKEMKPKPYIGSFLPHVSPEYSKPESEAWRESYEAFKQAEGLWQYSKTESPSPYVGSTLPSITAKPPSETWTQSLQEVMKLKQAGLF